MFGRYAKGFGSIVSMQPVKGDAAVAEAKSVIRIFILTNLPVRFASRQTECGRKVIDLNQPGDTWKMSSCGSFYEQGYPPPPAGPALTLKILRKKNKCTRHPDQILGLCRGSTHVAPESPRQSGFRPKSAWKKAGDGFARRLRRLLLGGERHCGETDTLSGHPKL